MNVFAKTIPEARFMLMKHCINNGYKQNITKGSFSNTEIFRIQLPVAMCTITNHLVDRVPVPPSADWPSEMTMEKGERYFEEYLLFGGSHVNEAYTYGSRIHNQLEDVIHTLSLTPDTNQAAIAVGREEDTKLEDPACLREIHFKKFNDKLHLYSIWRTHDLYAGFPLNMYGLSRLLEMVAEAADIPIGSLYYYSSGSHIYSYVL